jgi:putative redox protein
MVTGSRKDKFVVEMMSGVHKIISDVTEDQGGTDLGPNPHELLEAALTACTIMTLQMYANRKNWPLISANVKVTIDKEGANSHITREISLTGELSPEQKKRLIDIANMCPIHLHRDHYHRFRQ